ncbi:hypothetical protein V6N13_049120 [Hibiscus sabdariffa]
MEASLDIEVRTEEHVEEEIRLVPLHFLWFGWERDRPKSWSGLLANPKVSLISEMEYMVLELLRNDRKVQVRHIHQEGNAVAASVARSTRDISSGEALMPEPPAGLEGVIEDEQHDV